MDKFQEQFGAGIGGGSVAIGRFMDNEMPCLCFWDKQFQSQSLLQLVAALGAADMTDFFAAASKGSANMDAAPLYRGLCVAAGALPARERRGRQPARPCAKLGAVRPLYKKLKGGGKS